ncbi:MAG: hypothetical protein DMG39_13460 [Acidobacteria bacterium]|nr:MAG: hypothetical protein DMG39_13460 [Acidobacteriota bacterium]
MLRRNHFAVFVQAVVVAADSPLRSPTGQDRWLPRGQVQQFCEYERMALPCVQFVLKPELTSFASTILGEFAHPGLSFSAHSPLARDLGRSVGSAVAIPRSGLRITLVAKCE